MTERSKLDKPQSSIRIPYGRHSVDAEDIEQIVEVLKSDWITQGPKVKEFEQAVAHFSGTEDGVAFSSGTAALHGAVYAAGIKTGDEVLVPTMTFAATANVVVYQGGTPVFVDVDPDTLLVDIHDLKRKITPRTKAIISVDYAGQPCDYDALRALAKERGLILIGDASHALGAAYRGREVGTLADLTIFSFHPVKHMTTGEGGMVVTDDSSFAKKMGLFRSHGIDTDLHQRANANTWQYDMVDLGYNYRITDFQCALGLSQLKKLTGWIDRRRELAALYEERLKAVDSLRPLVTIPDRIHVYHLYVVRIDLDHRDALFSGLRNLGIGVNVHYRPVHLHSFYQKRFGTGKGLCPDAEAAYEKIISLPIYPAMSNEDVEQVVDAIASVLRKIECVP